ncbi:MAG: phenylalanine--tRNA ligase subunit alpha [Deltaproteobacteria bacterium]|nr:phenylalanine--tRNA ligase subunit alpha [Deltaproteobacteria bacterium]
MKSSLAELGREAVESIEKADGAAEIEEIRIKYLGKKGRITALMRQMGSIPPQDRPLVGQVANQVKEDLSGAIKAHTEAMAAGGTGLAGIDITLPGRRDRLGHRHPITRTTNEICGIFSRMGFDIAEGPEVELDYYNFEALNFPKDHPARDMQDTLYVSDNVVLRTHTSPMQIRTMEKKRPPVWVVIPGKTFRRDSDVSHTPMFHQIEGLVVDKGITFGDLKGVLTSFIHQFFSPETRLRFRPSFFPFTEPSAEVDIGCVICRGKGCRTCGFTGWIEILGSGMVDPEVYKFVDYDPQEITGFAFGVGMERMAMLKYGIEDARLFFDNDLRFLTQF